MEYGKGKILKQPDLFDVGLFDEINKDVKQKVPTEEELESWIIDPYLDSGQLGKGLMQTDLFNIESVEESNRAKKEKEHLRLVEEAQEKMKLPYFENPKNDNERLLNFQHDYIKNKDQKAWGELLTLSFIVAARIVRKEVYENKLPYDEVDQDEKTSIAVEYVLRRYKKNIGWYVSKSYISALKKGVIHAIYYQTKKDAETDSIECVMQGKI